MFSDKNKSKARNRYLVTSVNGEWCTVKKFVGNQLRATSYKVKQSECYAVPHDISEPSPVVGYDEPDSDIEDPQDKHMISSHSSVSEGQCNTCVPNMPPSQIGIPEILSLPADIQCDSQENEPSDVEEEFSIPNDSGVLDLKSSVQLHPESDFQACSRPHRSRRPPKYLQDYVT